MALCPILSDNGRNAIHKVEAYNQFGDKHQINIAGEEPLTIKVDGKALVTLMTLGTHPELLVLGYLRNQGIFESIDDIKSVTVDWDREVAEVETIMRQGIKSSLSNKQPNKKINGHALDRILEKLRAEPLHPVELKKSYIYDLVREVKNYNYTYSNAGSVHGCGLCERTNVIKFIEDVGRHSATDALSGYMWLNNISGHSKIFYTTGRLTSEIVIKSAVMGIPVLISRNGTTHMGFQLAQQLGVTLVSRAKGRHFVTLNDYNVAFDRND